MRWADLSVEQRTIGQVLQQQAAAIGDQLFLRDESSSWTYAAADERSNRLARGFASLGVAPADRVALFTHNSATMALVALGLSKLGAIWIPLNTALVGSWLRDAVKRTRPKVIVVDAELVDLLREADAVVADHLVVIGSAASLDGSHTPVLELGDLVSDDASALEPRDYREVNAVMWTSGTTGEPKGVMQTHSSWLLGSRGLSSYRAFEEGDVLYCCLPMFNSGGWSLHVFGAMVAGLTVAIDRHFTASGFWDRCRFYGATQILTLGAMYDFLLQAAPEDGDRDHRVRVAACIPIPPGRVEEFKERFGIPLLWNGYAQSEFLWMFGAHPEKQWKPGSCGVANERIEVAILDPHDRPLPPGEVGEICARPKDPHLMFAGYFDDPEATLAATRNLWYHTGDMGFLDEDGELFFADRKSDLIRFGGRTISAAEVETAALGHPAVARCAAYGIAAENLESEAEVMLAVVLEEGAELEPVELARHINDNAPHYLVPRYIEIVDDLPITPTGKIEKRTLKARGVSDATWDRVAAGYQVRRHGR